jgi:hypothetical protein
MIDLHGSAGDFDGCRFTQAGNYKVLRSLQRSELA